MTHLCGQSYSNNYSESIQRFRGFSSAKQQVSDHFRCMHAGEPGGLAVSTSLTKHQRLFQQIASGAALLAAVGVGLLMLPGQRLLSPRDNDAQIAIVEQRAIVEPIVMAPESFDKAAAKMLLERWQVCNFKPEADVSTMISCSFLVRPIEAIHVYSQCQAVPLLKAISISIFLHIS